VRAAPQARQTAALAALDLMARAAVVVAVTSAVRHPALAVPVALALSTQSPQAARLVLAAAVVVAADLKGLEVPAV
jgi:hypothetical protein